MRGVVGANGNGGNLSCGCRWLIDIFNLDLVNCVVLNPETGYLPFDCNVFCFIFAAGCFGITNAVCFNSERSLHNADINGKSKCLLRSRNIFISIGVAGDVIALVDVELVTAFVDSPGTIFIDAFVRGRVVVTLVGCDLPTRGAVENKNYKNLILDVLH